MLLYTSRRAPNPRRVALFVLHKGIDVPTQWVDLGAGEHLQPDYLALNPDGLVPVLQLDDGSRISESVAICRALEA